MSTVLYDDLVSEFTFTSGTGAISLGGANLQSFRFTDTFAIGAQIYYAIRGRGLLNADIEEGIGTLTSANSFARTTVLRSSAGGLVNFGPGIKDIYSFIPALELRNLNAALTAQIASDAVLAATVASNSVAIASNAATIATQAGTITTLSASLAALTTTVASLSATVAGLTGGLVVAGSAPSGTVGVSYSAQFTASGGTAPYTYSVGSGSLPAGLSLNAATGLVSGTPSAAATSTFVIHAVGSAGKLGDSGSQSVVIAAGGSALSISGTAPGGTSGVAYSFQFTGSGGTAPRTFAVLSGSLPAGLSLSSSGLLSGTPSTVATSAFVVQVTDAVSATANSSQFVAIGAAGADTRPRYANGPANSAGTGSVFDAFFTGATALGGSSNGGKAGTVTVAPDSTKYGWLFIPASADASGIHVVDASNAPGGWSGATSAAINSGGDPADPITVRQNYTDSNSNTWHAYRTNGKASAASYTVS